jgi:hypothetical protein
MYKKMRQIHDETGRDAESITKRNGNLRNAKAVISSATIVNNYTKHT